MFIGAIGLVVHSHLILIKIINSVAYYFNSSCRHTIKKKKRTLHLALANWCLLFIVMETWQPLIVLLSIAVIAKDSIRAEGGRRRPICK